MIDGQPQPHQVYVPHLNLRICYLVRPDRASTRRTRSTRVICEEPPLIDRQILHLWSVRFRSGCRRQKVNDHHDTSYYYYCQDNSLVSCWHSSRSQANTKRKDCRQLCGCRWLSHISESDKESCGTGSMGAGFLCSCSLIWSIFRTFAVCGGNLPGSATWTVNVSESPEQINR